jgi:hypothetical protein
VDLGDNVWDVEFDPPDEWSEAAERAGFGPVRGKRLRRQPGATLSSAVWELDPGAMQSPYHFHHGGEELTPEIIEYPDSGKIASRARTETTGGGPLFSLSRLADDVDYFEGESA